MQEKKNKRLLMVLIVLISATVILFWMGREKRSFTADKTLFKNYDLQSIDEVMLESPAGKVILKYTGAGWKVNDQYEADPNMVKVLFATLQQAEPKRPMAASLQDSLSKALENGGVQVTLRSKGNVIESFQAGGNARKTQAYFKKADSREVYLMGIPGYRVYVSGIFELHASGWRDKYVFGFNWRNFQRLEALFSNSTHNFTVVMEENHVAINELPLADTAKLNDFLDQVSLLTVNEYIINSSFLDSLAKTSPMLTLQVLDIAKNEYSLKLYRPSQPERGEFYGLIGDSQWATFQQARIGGLLRPKDFFVKR